MRLALVISSAYENSVQLPSLPVSIQDAELWVRRLGDTDTGFVVEHLEADRRLPERLDEVLGGQEVEQLLLVFAGYAVLSAQRGAALLLDGPRVGALSLGKLRAVVAAPGRAVHVVLDVGPLLDPGMTAADFLHAVARDLGGVPGLSGVAAVRRPEAQQEPSDCAVALLSGLDWLSVSGTERVTADHWVAVLRGNPHAMARLAGVDAFGALGAFELLPEAGPTRVEARPQEFFQGVGDLDEDDEVTPRPALIRAPIRSGEYEVATGLPTEPWPPTETHETAAVELEPELDEVSERATPAMSPWSDDAPTADSPLPDGASELDAGSPDWEGADTLPRFRAASALEPEAADSTEPTTSVGFEPPEPPSSEPGWPGASSVEPVEPESVEPESVEPESVEPEPAEPVEPEFAEHEPVEPEPAEPEPAEPVEPEFADHEPVEPESVQPEPPSAEPRGSTGSEPREPEPNPFDDATDVTERDHDLPPSDDEPITISRYPAREAPVPELGAPGATGLDTPPVWTWQPPAGAPAVETLIAQGDEWARAGQLERATEEYKRALLLLGGGRSSLRAALYVRLGDAAQHLGRVQVALNNYDKALAIEPGHAEARAHVRALLVPLREFERLAELEERRLQAATTESQRVLALQALATLWLDDAGDKVRGQQALERWLAAYPDDPVALDRLAATHHALGQHAQAIDCRVRRAALLSSRPEQKARALLDATREVCEQLGDAEYAVYLAEQALEADPGALEALELAASLLSQVGDLSRLANVYERVLSRTPDGLVALEICRKLGRLCQRELADPERAARAYERALAIEPADAELHVALADLYDEAGHSPQALAHCRAAIALAPRAARAFRRAHAAFEKLGWRDAAWNAASALEYLGEADINESLVAHQHRPEGLVGAQATLTESDWRSGLLYAERDPRFAELIVVLRESALESRGPLVKKERAWLIPEGTQPHDLEKSTTTVGKTLGWSARLLSIPAPLLFIVPEAPGDLVTLLGPEPRIVANKFVASGLGVAELAFLWARQLTMLRPEHDLALLYGSVHDVAELFGAALLAAGLAQPDGFTAEARRTASAIRRRWADPAALQRACAVLGGDVSGAAHAWLRSVHLAALRAGLLACGDVSVASHTLARFRRDQVVSVEEQIDVLLAYCISDGYGELRQRLGIALAG